MLEKRSAGQRPAAARAPLSGGERLAPRKTGMACAEKDMCRASSKPDILKE